MDEFPLYPRKVDYVEEEYRRNQGISRTFAVVASVLFFVTFLLAVSSVWVVSWKLFVTSVLVGVLGVFFMKMV